MSSSVSSDGHAAVRPRPALFDPDVDLSSRATVQRDGRSDVAAFRHVCDDRAAALCAPQPTGNRPVSASSAGDKRDRCARERQLGQRRADAAAVLR